MNVLGIGVDLVEVSRIADAVTRHGERFLHRVFTPQEISTGGRRPERLAARFAAKEAVAKAFGTGIGASMAFVEIEVVNEPSGQPRIDLHGSAAATARHRGVGTVLITLSHTGTHAIAHAMLIGK